MNKYLEDWKNDIKTYKETGEYPIDNILLCGQCSEFKNCTRKLEPCGRNGNNLDGFRRADAVKIDSKVKAGLYGAFIGDALGVPYEFKSREALKKNPCTEMIEFGTHGQYLGTWSDDSSLMLASMVAVLQGGSLIVDIGKNSVAWMDQGEFSPYGEVFDIGNQTRIALEKFKKGARVPKNPNNAGNGSLMRILPFGMYKTNKEWGPRIKDIINISDLTHNNFECELACGMYCYLVDRLLSGVSFKEAWKDSQMFIDKHSKWPSSFERLVRGDFENISEDEIKSSGYVIDTLEAAIWCVMNSNSYSEAVLKAVNLGDDTDTVACVAGGLAGIVFDDIPYKWIQALARTQALNVIFTEFNKKCK